MFATNTMKRVSLEQLKENREYLNMGGVALTIGTFDLFHAGHIDFLSWCKRSSDTLVVGIKSDKLCGNKTFCSEKDREDILLALTFVDFTCVIDDVGSFIKTVNPEFYFKGPHYNFDNLSDEEKNALDSSGTVDGFKKAEIKFAPLSRDLSKGEILKKIYEYKGS